MAEGIRYNVTCGVTEEGKTITLMYTVPDPLDRISWEWIHKQNEDGTYSHTAAMTAQDSKRGHKSKPVPDGLFKQLGSPKKSRENVYCKVKMSRTKDDVSIEEYF